VVKSLSLLVLAVGTVVGMTYVSSEPPNRGSRSTALGTPVVEPFQQPLPQPPTPASLSCAVSNGVVIPLTKTSSTWPWAYTGTVRRGQYEYFCIVFPPYFFIGTPATSIPFPSASPAWSATVGIRDLTGPNTSFGVPEPVGGATVNGGVPAELTGRIETIPLGLLTFSVS